MIGIYIRVSSREQAMEGYSIPAQKERLKAYCKAHGWEDYKFYIDPGISAKDMKRPSVQQLKKDVSNGKIRTVLVYRLDRLTRSVRDLYDFLDFLEKYECTFKSATELYDTSNAMGRMFIGLVALLAQWERENLGERVEMALEERASELKAIGRAPFGFMIKDEYYAITDNETERSTLETIIRMALEGGTHNGIARHLNSRSIPTPDNGTVWYASTVKRLLTNPALYGAYYYGGKLTENAFEGYISKKEFGIIQEKLKSRATQPVRGTSQDAIFQGVVSCPKCGHKVSPSVAYSKKDGRKLNYAYKCRRCRDRDNYHKSYSEPKLLDALYEYMEFGFKVPPQREAKQDNKHEQIKEQIERIENQRLKYQRAWSMEFMTDEEFKELMGETKSTLNELNEELEEVADNKKEIDYEAIQSLMWTFNQNFKHLTAIEKRNFMNRFIKNIEIKVHSKVVPNRKRPRETFEVTNIEFYL